MASEVKTERRFSFDLILLLVLALLAGSCATAGFVGTYPGKGEPWREITSAHFRVKTNLDSWDSIDAIRRMENYRHALLLAFGANLDPPGHLEVIIFRERSQLQEFVRDPVGGFVYRGTAGLLLVMGPEERYFGMPDVPRIQLHELAHYVSFFALLRQPRWLAEGLAAYLETIFVDERRGIALLGLRHWHYLNFVRYEGWLSLQRLWEWTHQKEEEGFYASSWLWVHYLRNRHEIAFRDFERGLARAEDPRRAWERAFQGISSEDLERGLKNYFSDGQFRTEKIQFAPPPKSFQAHLLTVAEVHLLRATLFVATPRPRETRDEFRSAAIAELNEALRKAPSNVDATIALAGYRGDGASERVRIGRELVKSNPDSGRAWNFLGSGLIDDEAASKEREMAFARAAELSPEEPLILNALALEYITQGKPSLALPLANKAWKLLPWNASVLDTYATALAGTGDCLKAIELQNRAIEMDVEHFSAAGRKEMQDRLNRYQRECQAKR